MGDEISGISGSLPPFGPLVLHGLSAYFVHHTSQLTHGPFRTCPSSWVSLSLYDTVAM